RLKEMPGGPIDSGGAGMGNTLAELGLIDELRMVVNPYVLGSGKPFLGPAFSKSKWKLVEQKSFSSSILFHYEKA
ncbi:MAG: dihydrofolate reductase family protein, partial [Actinomycetota bacterium]|nr:dihydrofolate reductase family protein [Actinomycetota bacterium]